MINRKIWTVALVLVMGLSGYGKPGIPVMFYPTEQEQVAMLNEADDMIDDMADGQMDRQADAIYHAMRGVGGELASLRSLVNKSGKSVSGVETLDITGDGSARGLKMRLYRPAEEKGKKLPLLVYFHGGGWSVGGLDSCREFCETVAAQGKAMVLAADYSLAPENPFPAPLNDCEGVLAYAFSHAEEWGSEKDLVSVGGDSAGGNLALASALALQQRNDVGNNLRSIVLLYPILKAYNDKSASWKKYSRGYGLDGRLMEAYCESYTANGKAAPQGVKNVSLSPAEADDSSLKKLPPILMISAERDILYDQGKEFTDRIKKLGKNIDRVEFPGAIHLFATDKGQPTAFKKAVALTSVFLQE